MSPIGRLGQAVVAITGLATGLLTAALAKRADTASWAGRAWQAQAVLLVAGWALIAAGVTLAGRPRQRASGVLLVAAGFAWFVADWDNQFAGSAVVFTAGLMFSAVAPVLVGHALLRYGGQPLDRLGRAGVTAGYASTVVVAVLAAVFFEPARQGCAACATNLLALRSDPSMVDRLGQFAVAAGPVWCLLLALALAAGLAHAGGARRRLDAPAVVPGIAYLAAVAAGYAAAAGRAYLPVDRGTRLLWSIQGCLLVLVALGTGWPWLQRRLTRARLAGLVLEMAAAPPVGGLTRVLSPTLRDSTFRVLYPLGDGRLVDASGVATGPGDGQAVTPVVRGRNTLALLAHRPGLLDEPGLPEEIAAVARLVLDSERLQAVTQAQLADLQASRARIVRAGDAERRRLERDLHDGAQQHLVALSLGLQLATLRTVGNRGASTRLVEAREEVADALAELRTLARGIYPRELADEGIAAALETLAEGATAPLTIEAAPEQRLPHAVEAAAYRVVEQITRQGTPARVRAAAEGGRFLTVDVVTGGPPPDLVDLQDRVGALGGRLTLADADPGATMVRAELPCAW